MIDIGRHYPALFVEKTKPPNATKRLVDEDGASGTGDRPTDAAARAAIVANDGDRATHVTQDLSQEIRARRRNLSNGRRRRRKNGRNKDSKAAEMGPLSSCGAENGHYLCDKNHSREAQRVGQKDKKEESASDLSTRGVVVESMMIETRAESNNKGSRVVTDSDGWTTCGKTRESENERAQSGWVKAEGGSGGTGKEEGARQRQDHSPDDCVESYSSDYGEEPFEPIDESETGCVEVGVDDPAYLASRGDAGDVIGDNAGRREEPPCSGHGSSMAEETWSEERSAAVDAAALRIEICWRGFRGRCAARIALRSALLAALRNIGGGKISKVTHARQSE